MPRCSAYHWSKGGEQRCSELRSLDLQRRESGVRIEFILLLLPFSEPKTIL